jgi:DNA polymerase II small subunit/DNA polymerase delta subunit B
MAKKTKKKLDTSKIDDAINNAKRRVKARTGEDSTVDTDSKVSPKPKRKRLSPEDREARDKARAEEKAQKKADREAARAAKKAEKEANRKPAHMAKVEKALAALPALSETASATLADITGSLELSDLENLAAHIQGTVRLERTKQALDRTLAVGQAVTIVGGDNRFIGKTATVVRAQRIRCYVEVPGFDKEVYLFTSDVQPVEGGQEVEDSADESQEAATA